MGLSEVTGACAVENPGPIHSRLRERFGKIVNTVDFGVQSDSGSSSQSPSMDQRNQPPRLHKGASEIIRDFIDREHISLIIMSDASIGIGETAAIRGLRGDVRYTYHLINGAFVSVPMRNLTALIKRPFVTEIWPNAQGNLELDRDVENWGVEKIGADKVHSLPQAGGLGITGEGVRVAVVDIGIDENHPEFRNRIIDRRHLSTDKDHGTQVAGIIGAADDGNDLTGVAPGVQLLNAGISSDLRRINNIFFSEVEVDYGEAMNAIGWAAQKHSLSNAKEKADIINMSLGWEIWDYGREGVDPMSELIDEVVTDGVIFVKSAGNDGYNRVSGTIDIESPPDFHAFEKRDSNIEIYLMWYTGTSDLDLVILDANGEEVISSRTTQDHPKEYSGAFCEQVTLTEPNGWYELKVEAASLKETDQHYEAWVSRGAYFTYVPGPVSVPEYSKRTVSVPGYSRTAITVGAVASDNEITGFSSRGPSDTNLMKPEIVAPGKEIVSTIRGRSYDSDSGTSFAAPHVAGVAALILDAVGKNDQGEWNFDPFEVKSAIVRGAEDITNDAPDNTYGAGLVKADNVIFGGTVPANRRLRFEIEPRLYDFDYNGYTLNADRYLLAAISWENPAHDLDLVLSDARSGETLPITSQVASSSVKIGGPEILPRRGATYFLEVLNNSEAPVMFTGAATHKISSSPPDLVIASVSANKDTLEPDENFRLDTIVVNQGGKESTPTTLRFYRSSDPVISSEDPELRTTSIKGLKVGEQITPWKRLTAPDSPGTYYYGVCVDSGGDELVIDNNCSEGVQIRVVPPDPPDLVIASISVNKDTLDPGENFRLDAIVQNQGKAASEPTTVRFYRSSDPDISSEDTELHTTAIRGLKVGEQITPWKRFTAPDSPGTYYYGVCIDAVEGENKTANNCSAVSVTVGSSSPPLADLEIGDAVVVQNASGGGLNGLVVRSGAGGSFPHVASAFNGATGTITDGPEDNGYRRWQVLWDASDQVLCDINPCEGWVVESFSGSYVLAKRTDSESPDEDFPRGDLEVLAHTSWVWSVAFSPDGNTLASGSEDGTAHLWNARTGEHIRTLEGHTGRVYSVAFNPNGTTLASGSRDGTVRLWNANTGAHIRTLSGRHTSWVTGVSFSPTGNILASGSLDRTIRLWNTRTGAHIRTLSGTSSVLGVSFSPNGTTLASGNDDGTVRLWNARTGAHVRTLSGHTRSVLGVSFSPTGNILASGSRDDTAHLWNARTGEHIRTLEGHTTEVSSVAFSPDGNTLASGSYDNTIRLWNARTGAHIQTLEGHTGLVYSVAFSPDGTTLASGSYDQTVRLWEVQNRPDLVIASVSVDKDTLDPGENFRLDAIVRNQGQVDAPSTYLRYYRSSDSTISVNDTEVGSDRITTPDAGETYHRWENLTAPEAPGVYYYGVCVDSVDDELVIDNNCSEGVLVSVVSSTPTTPRLARTLTGHTGGVRSVVFSPDGTTLASGSRDNTIRLWNANTGTPIRTLTEHTEPVNSVAFSPDSNTFASGGWDDTIRLWNANIGTPIRTLIGHTHNVESVAFSPDGSILTSGSSDDTIRLWNANTGTPIRTLTEHTNDVNSVAFSSDGSILASGSSDDTIRLWDADTGRHLQTLTGHTNDVNSVSFSPDGTTLASGSYDNTIRLWNVDTGRHLQTLTGHTRVVESVTFSPDGTTLASGSWDSTICLWDANNGFHLWTLTEHTGPVLGVAFSPDGSILASGSYDQTIRLWDLRPSATTNTIAGLAPKWFLASTRPTDTQLLANYPNPFNPETWIPYHLSESTDVRVNIYDSQGVLVRALPLGHQSVGYYTSRSRAAYWDGRNALGERVASGIYFYQLETDAEVSPLRKMVILK